MAILDITFKSYILKRNVGIKVILPVEDTTHMSSEPVGKPEKFKTLYLLHGFTGNSTDWLYSSGIAKYARDKNLAVVMPSGENSFYEDNEKTGIRYGTYVGKEIVDITRRMFPLSERKEDTYIGGISMGGFGSLLLGSRFADTFGAIICLSSGFILVDIAKGNMACFEEIGSKEYFEHIFGDLNRLSEHSDKHPLCYVDGALDQKKLPPIYMACGTGDFLYQNNVKVRDILIQKGADVTWEEGEGEHSWEFWDIYIQKAVSWLFGGIDEECNG